VSPVLAVVGALERRANQQHQSLKLLYIGQRSGVEAELAKEAGLAFTAVAGGKYRRVPGGLWHNLRYWRETLQNLRDLFLILTGALQSAYQLYRFKPDVIFNKAGPTGLPVGLAARWLGIPMVIHEPDVVPGMANKLLSKWASQVAVGFPAKYYSIFPAEKVVYTGTPVRPELLQTHSKAQARQFFFGDDVRGSATKPVVLIMGGSQGAREINELVGETLPQLTKKVRVLHVLGMQADLEAVQQAAAQAGVSAAAYHSTSYLGVDSLALAYQLADVVVTRSGASTIAELASLHKPTILIPNRVMAAHQVVNATVLMTEQAAEVLMDDKNPMAEIDPKRFSATILRIAGSATERQRLRRQIAAFDQSQATERLAGVIEAAAGRGRGAA
jgi:UDP-N-acetylglucosamine--N-acetylmuramyl-(pentapeptide) pyrophosphoryl-undecaprenol N-acetylglucosamine transferase